MTGLRKVWKPNLIYDQCLMIRVWLNVLAGIQLAPSESPTKNTAGCWVWSRLNPSLTSCHLGSGAWPEISRVSCSCPRAIFKFKSRGDTTVTAGHHADMSQELVSSVSMAELKQAHFQIWTIPRVVLELGGRHPHDVGSICHHCHIRNLIIMGHLVRTGR